MKEVLDIDCHEILLSDVRTSGIDNGAARKKSRDPPWPSQVTHDFVPEILPLLLLELRAWRMDDPDSTLLRNSDRLV